MRKNNIKRFLAVTLVATQLFGITQSMAAVRMDTHWNKEANNWYLLDGANQKLTGWQETASGWYYMNPTDGVMATDWQNINGTWYYLKANGAMATGWQEINNEWYYMNDSGAMITNQTIDGWKLDESGRGTNASKRLENSYRNPYEEKELKAYYDEKLVPKYGQLASNTVKEYCKTAIVGDGVRKYKVENENGLVGYKMVSSSVDGRAYMFTSRYQDVSEMDRNEGYKTHTVKLVMDVYSVEGDNVQKINKDNMWMRTYGDNTYQMAYAEKEDGIHMYVTRNMNVSDWEGGMHTTGIIEYLINDGNMTRISKNNEIEYLNNDDFGFYKNRGILPNIDSKWNKILEKYFYECDENSKFGSLKSKCGEDVNCDGYFVENPFVRELTETEKDLNMIAYFGRTKCRDEAAGWDPWTEEWTCKVY